MSGRDFDDHEALRLGLATEPADDPVARAEEIARVLLTRSPDAVRTIKPLALSGRAGDPIQGLHDQIRASASLVGTPNQMEAVRAAFENREPTFGEPLMAIAPG